VNWWSYVILILAVRFFLRHTVEWCVYTIMKKSLRTCLLVSTEYTNVTLHDSIGRACAWHRAAIIDSGKRTKSLHSGVVPDLDQSGYPSLDPFPDRNSGKLRFGLFRRRCGAHVSRSRMQLIIIQLLINAFNSSIALKMFQNHWRLGLCPDSELPRLIKGC